MYGAQTKVCHAIHSPEFENDVEMYGAQTLYWVVSFRSLFENDVEMYGAQTAQSEKMLF